MGSGASTQCYDQESARELAGSLWNAESWNAKIDDNEDCCTLSALEEVAGVVALPFPLDGLIFELTAYGARRYEEDGDSIVDAAGGARVQAGSLVAQTGTSLAWESAISLPDGVAFGDAYTLAIWLRIAPDVQPLGEFTPLVSCEGGDAPIVLRRNARLTAFAGGSAAEDLSLFDHDRIDGSRWMLLFASAAAPRCPAKGVAPCQPPPTVLSVASDERMVRQLGSVQARCVGNPKLKSLGGPGVAVSEAYLWTRELLHDEKNAVFARGAARHAVFDDTTLVHQLLTGEARARSQDNAARFAALLECIANGASNGIADLSDWGVCDAELRSVLSAVRCNTSLVELRLARNTDLSSRGATAHLLAFLETARTSFVLDLSGCGRIGADDEGFFESAVIEVFSDGPEDLGVIVRADGTGLSPAAVDRLKNATPAAEARATASAHAAAASETQAAAFLAMQAQLDAMWAAELDDEASTNLGDADLSEAITRLQAVAAAPVGAPALLTAELAALAPAPRMEPEEGEDMGEYKKKGRKEPRRHEGESEAAYQARLAEAAAKYKEYLEARKKSREALKEAAEAASILEKPKAKRGSGMLMAHFAYIGGVTNALNISPYSHFGLKHAGVDGERKLGKYQGVGGMLEFHAAISAGVLTIASASGHSFGKKALHLELRNESPSTLQVVLCGGTIFEHIAWVHRQNLMVIADFQIVLTSKSSASYSIDAHCMNSMCSCSNGNPMYLTDYYFTDREVLPHQGRVWDHFNTCLFSQKGSSKPKNCG